MDMFERRHKNHFGKVERSMRRWAVVSGIVSVAVVAVLLWALVRVVLHFTP